MVKRRHGSSGDAKWCVCCLLFSLQIVSTLTHIQTTGTGLQLKTRSGQLTDLWPNPVSRNSRTLTERKTRSTLPSQRVQTDTLEDQRDRVTTLKQTLSEGTVGGNSTEKTPAKSKVTDVPFTTVARKNVTMYAQTSNKFEQDNKQTYDSTTTLNNSINTVLRSTIPTLTKDIYGEKNVGENVTHPNVEKQTLEKALLGTGGITVNMSVENIPLTEKYKKSNFATTLRFSSSRPHSKVKGTNLLLNSKAEELVTSLPTEAHLSTSVILATFKTVQKKLTKHNSTSGEDTNLSLIPFQEFKASLFRTSKENSVTEPNLLHGKSSRTPEEQYATTESSLKMTQYSRDTDKLRDAATAFSDHLQGTKSTMIFGLHQTRRRADGPKSTAKLQRSTREITEVDSTLPSSTRKSNKAAASDTVTLRPSNLDLLEEKKRLVPHQYPNLYNNLDCPNSVDDYTHHSIEWSDKTTLTVELHGDGEALAVNWEVVAEKRRHGRDTEIGAAARHVEGSHSAEVVTRNSSHTRPDAPSPNLETSDMLVNGFVVSYRIPGDEEYDSSRLRAGVRSFVLHQLHPDEDYIICVHAMSGQHRVYEKCATWSKSLLKKKATMGILAGSLFFLPCVAVIIIIIRKDRRMRAKTGSGHDSWQRTHPSLVRGFSTCEESREASEKKVRSGYDRSIKSRPSLVYIHDGRENSIVHLSPEHANQNSTDYSHAHNNLLTKMDDTEDQLGLRTSTPRDSMNNLLETDILSDGDLTLFHGVEEDLPDSAYSNPTVAPTNHGSTPSHLTSHQIPKGTDLVPDPNRETNI